jgi:hypothetical protein
MEGACPNEFPLDGRWLTGGPGNNPLQPCRAPDLAMVRVGSNQPLFYRDSRSINSVKLGNSLTAASPQLSVLDADLHMPKRMAHDTRTDALSPRVRKDNTTIAKPRLSPDVVLRHGFWKRSEVSLLWLVCVVHGLGQSRRVWKARLDGCHKGC